MQSNEEKRKEVDSFRVGSWPATPADLRNYMLPSLRKLELLPCQSKPTSIANLLNPEEPKKKPQTQTKTQSKPQPEIIWVDETNQPATRHPRWKYNKEQLDALNKVLKVTYFPSNELRLKLATELDLSPRTVQIWFQNKRQTFKSKHGHLPANKPSRSSPSHYDHFSNP